MKVAVIGAGFVGVSTAVVLSERGHDVFLVERDDARVAALAAGRLPFFEPGLEAALRAAREADRLHPTGDMRLVDGVDAVVLCVGTPSMPDGAVDLSQLAEAAGDLAPLVAEGPRDVLVVVKSTVPPGTTRKLVAPIVRDLADPGVTVHVAMAPEFLREGSALQDAREPDRVVLGLGDEAARDRAEALFAVPGRPTLVMSPDAAELVKYAANAMLATRIAFANELANLAETVGADVDEVMRAVGMDDRIGPHFLHAGLGFGGSCFPKDLRAIRAFATERGVDLGIIEAALENNDLQPLRAVDLLRAELGELEGRRVALLGLAFKPHTSDVRETRALPIYEALVESGVRVVCHDPVAGEEFQRLAPGPVRLALRVEDALKGADACILVTEWPEYRDVPAERFVALMRQPLVVDGRRALDRDALAAAGVRYRGIGVGQTVPAGTGRPVRTVPLPAEG